MIYWLLHGFVAAIFLRAGIGKLLGRRDFYWQLRASAVLPRQLIAPASYVIPILELCTGFGVLPAYAGLRLAETSAVIMLAAFTGYTLWITMAGRTVRCFCFGRDDGEINWVTVTRNGMMLCIVVLTAVGPIETIPTGDALLGVIDGATASFLFVGAFQMHAMRRELAKR
jgi:hypothetical protein